MKWIVCAVKCVIDFIPWKISCEQTKSQRKQEAFRWVSILIRFLAYITYDCAFYVCLATQVNGNSVSLQRNVRVKANEAFNIHPECKLQLITFGMKIFLLLFQIKRTVSFNRTYPIKTSFDQTFAYDVFIISVSLEYVFLWNTRGKAFFPHVRYSFWRPSSSFLSLSWHIFLAKLLNFSFC